MGFKHLKPSRIASLPRRSPYTDAERDALREQLQCGTWRLFDHQVDALLDIRACRGAVLDVSPGAGKTAVSFLAPTVLGSKRSVLYVQASLLEKTFRDFVELRQQFRVKTEPLVKTYTSISLDDNAEELTRYDPDLLIFDECDRLANYTSGRTRRLRTWLGNRPEVAVVAMSGTLVRRGWQDVAHVAYWCLQDGSPLPDTRSGAELLGSQANSPSLANTERQPPTGWLLEVMGKLNQTDPTRAVADWCRGTPGWYSTEFRFDGVPVTINTVEVASSPETDQFYDYAEANMKDYQGRALVNVAGASTPQGFERATTLWRLAGDLALGYYTVYDPPPPAEYLKARQDWHKLVDRHINEYHTPSAIAALVDAGALPGRPVLERWRSARDSTRLEAKAFCVDPLTPAMRYAADWLKTHPRGVVWVERVEAARRLSELSGRPWFGGGQGGPGRPFIEDAEGSVIATIGANSVGKNLQHKWCDNLVITGRHVYASLDQLLARTYRIGQTRPVTATWLLVDGLGWRQHAALEKAGEGARFSDIALASTSIFSLAGFLNS